MLQCFCLIEQHSLNGNQIEDIYDPGRASVIKIILSYSSNLSRNKTLGWILEDSIYCKIQKYTEISLNLF